MNVDLVRVGLRPGEHTRFRPLAHRRWEVGRIAGMGADGSVVVHADDGSARSLRPEHLEVRRAGARGRLTWRNLAEVAVTWEQLELW